MNNSFAESLGYGQIGEGQIGRWIRSRGNCVLPVYEKEIDEGKGPRFFTPTGEHVAPDMFVMPAMAWAEAKRKSVFSWHRQTQQWVTGFDLNHYEGYKETQRESRRPVWLMFLHESHEPDPRDVKSGCPYRCPTGLFGGSLDYLSKHENHRHENWGRHGMVYWAVHHLKKLAELSEIQQIANSFEAST